MENWEPIKPFFYILFGLFSKRNSRVFAYLFLSLVPAAFLQCLLMNFDVLHVKDHIEILFFHLEYTKYVSPAWGVAIQPGGIMGEIILVLILMKLSGWWRPLSENYDREDSGKIENLVVAATLFGMLLWIIYSKSFFLSLLFLLVGLNIFLGKLRNILLVFLLFMILNLFSVSFYYQDLDIAFVIDGEEMLFLTFFTKIALAWLYTVPSNFFMFFPLFVGSVLGEYKYPEEYIKGFFDSFLHKNIVPFSIGIIANIFLCFIPILFILSSIEPPRNSLFGETPIDPLVEFLHSMLGSEVAPALTPYQIFTLMSIFMGSILNWFILFLTNLMNIEENFLSSFRRRIEDILRDLNHHIVFLGINSLNLRIWHNLVNVNPKKYSRHSQLLGRDFRMWKIHTTALFSDFDPRELENTFSSETGILIGTFRCHTSRKLFEDMVLAVSGEVASRDILGSLNLDKADVIIGSFNQELQSDIYNNMSLACSKSTFSIVLRKLKEYQVSVQLIHRNELEGETIARSITTILEQMEKADKKLSIAIQDDGSHISSIWNAITRESKEKTRHNHKVAKVLPFCQDFLLLKEAVKFCLGGFEEVNKFHVLENLEERTKHEESMSTKIFFINFSNSEERLGFLMRYKPDLICLYSGELLEVERNIREWTSCVQVCQSNDIYNPTFVVGLDEESHGAEIRADLAEILARFNLVFFDLWDTLDKEIMNAVSQPVYRRHSDIRNGWKVPSNG
jgi:hypothetical protein